MTPLVRLNDVSAQYGNLRALKDISLSIQPGERVALVGANGSGKSTLLRVVHGLHRIETGQLHSPPRRRQAMVFQRPFLLRASIRFNLMLGLLLRGWRWRDARQQAEQALARVQLSSLIQRNARALSGGQQQRVALAQAWACQPALLLLDEPTASLDPRSKREVEDLMQEFAQQTDTTLIFSSHNLGQVKRLASRVIYLENGRIEADLPVHDFFHGEVPEPAKLFLKGELL
ncbi:MAG: phosphate ABC transporter ATP-binding protein [Pigmentiphaga sp.]|nr:phosphate ABC transporter ATP-binding protein [Pigmentiphaga sp.]